MADSVAQLRWDGEQRFSGGAVGGPGMVVDGTGVAGPTPMTALLLALAGCMAIDVVDIAQKMRLEVAGLAVAIEADRRAEPPRRFTHIVLRFRVTGVAESDRPRLQRAIDLSAENYCSVYHTLQTDLAISTELELGGAGVAGKPPWEDG